MKYMVMGKKGDSVFIPHNEILRPLIYDLEESAQVTAASLNENAHPNTVYFVISIPSSPEKRLTCEFVKNEDGIFLVFPTDKDALDCRETLIESKIYNHAACDDDGRYNRVRFYKNED